MYNLFHNNLDQAKVEKTIENSFKQKLRTLIVMNNLHIFNRKYIAIVSTLD